METRARDRPLDLAHLRSLLAAATPGPLFFTSAGKFGYRGSVAGVSGPTVCETYNDADAALIARSRSLIVEQAAAIDALAARVEALEGALRPLAAFPLSSGPMSEEASIARHANSITGDVVITIKDVRRAHALMAGAEQAGVESTTTTTTTTRDGGERR